MTKRRHVHEYMIKAQVILLKGYWVLKYSSMIRKIICTTVAVKVIERNVLSDAGPLLKD